MSKQNKPALIVFGKKPRKPPRAAWFTAADAAVAQWIAQRYGLSTLKASPSVIHELSNPIAEWGFAPRGEPIIPTVKPDILDQLHAMADQATASGAAATDAAYVADGGAQPSATAQQHDAAKVTWGALTVGSLVLAQEDDPTGGWWEAVILAIHRHTCTLCFRDHPEDGLIKRELHQLAILHPDG